VNRQPRRSGDDELKFPNPFEEEAHETEQVRGSLPLLPSVGLGPTGLDEEDSTWAIAQDDADLPDQPLTWRRRLKWPAVAILCGLLLLAIAFVLIQ
jgi:hypothetical protein